jgi:two-component system cell cycle sensor histidine kinase/response regulator CckA
MIENNPSPGKSFNPWHFVWITVVMSELFTALMNTVQHYLDPHGDLLYLLRVGAVDALFVPLVVAPIIMYYMRIESTLKNINMQLEQEIAARKRIEEGLRESEEKFSLFMDHLPAIVFIKDADGRTVFVNKHMKESLGAHDWVGKTTRELFPPHIAGPMIADDERTMVHGYHMTVEHLPHADGSEHIYQTQKFAITGTGKAPLLGGLALDITGRIRAEEEKQALQEERLKTQKLEAVGTLAGGIAHDFNNLMQGVFGYIALAKMRRDDREGSLRALEEAEKALHMSVRLTNQLLTFSKGGIPLKKAIDLRPVIENAAKFALSGSRTDFHVAADDDLWMVEADEGQIGQVIQNIVLNADQAMPEGGRVRIRARNVARGGDLPAGLEKNAYVNITIQDSGVGIPEQYLARIFDPYFTTKEKGSGLGLATSYSIMKNHKGSIEAASERGAGTTFSLYLPAAGAMKTAEQDRPAPAAGEGRAGKVLLMDDEQVVRDVSAALITELGHRVEFAADGQEAVEKYRKAKRADDPFDIVILDVTIRGGMGGAETMRTLLWIDPGVKAVATSGYSEHAVATGYREQGFKAFLKKPYNVDELRDVLNRMLNA